MTGPASRPAAPATLAGCGRSVAPDPSICSAFCATRKSAGQKSRLFPALSDNRPAAPPARGWPVPFPSPSLRPGTCVFHRMKPPTAATQPPAQPATQTERRRAPRTLHQSDCRLLDPRTGRFLPAESCDRSATGARLLVRTTRLIEAGQSVALLMPSDRASVLCAQQAARAIVRRAQPLSEEQCEIALEFTELTNDAVPRAA